MDYNSITEIVPNGPPIPRRSLGSLQLESDAKGVPNQTFVIVGAYWRRVLQPSVTKDDLRRFLKWGYRVYALETREAAVEALPNLEPWIRSFGP